MKVSFSNVIIRIFHSKVCLLKDDYYILFSSKDTELLLSTQMLIILGFRNINTLYFCVELWPPVGMKKHSYTNIHFRNVFVFQISRYS